MSGLHPADWSPEAKIAVSQYLSQHIASTICQHSPVTGTWLTFGDTISTVIKYASQLT